MPHPPVHEAPAKLSRRFAASELVLMQVKADVASDVVLKKIRFGTYVKQLELNRTSCRIVDMPRTREENTEVCVIGEIFRRRVDRARPHPLDRFQRTIAPLVKKFRPCPTTQHWFACAEDAILRNAVRHSPTCRTRRLACRHALNHIDVALIAIWDNESLLGAEGKHEH